MLEGCAKLIRGRSNIDGDINRTKAQYYWRATIIHTTKNTKLCRFSKFQIPEQILAHRAFTSNNTYLIVYVDTYVVFRTVVVNLRRKSRSFSTIQLCLSPKPTKYSKFN